MTFKAEGRLSDSPFVECVWRGQADDDHTLMCPADGRLNLCFTRLRGKVQIAVEGPLTQAAPRTHVEGVDWLVIKFKLGAFMPCVPVRNLLNGEATLPNAVRHSFWLNSSTWQLPDYENADTFVDWLACDEVVQFDPVVCAALQDQPQTLSRRSVRHHFLQATGLTESHIRQIERAREAQYLLQEGLPILDVVEILGYADQPHLTRSVKRFMGYTPTQVTQFKIPR